MTTNLQDISIVNKQHKEIELNRKHKRYKYKSTNEIQNKGKIRQKHQESKRIKNIY